jgi:nucleoside-diphosphate-sugar epimerase
LRRDAYTQTKLFQEQMVRSYAASNGTSLVVARPGAIFGPGKDWDFGRALNVGRFNLIFAPGSRMRLIHVDNCADAIVAALDAPVTGEAIVNLVDDECPSHWTFHRAGQIAGLVKGTAIPVPYLAVLALGLAARVASKVGFAGRARLPEMLDAPRQRVRWRGLRYANTHARRLLNWQSRVTMAQAISEMAKEQAR